MGSGNVYSSFPGHFPNFSKAILNFTITNTARLATAFSHRNLIGQGGRTVHNISHSVKSIEYLNFFCLIR